MLLSRSAFAAPSKLRTPKRTSGREIRNTRSDRPISRGYSQFGEISSGSIPDFIGYPSSFNRVLTPSIEVPNDKFSNESQKCDKRRVALFQALRAGYDRTVPPGHFATGFSEMLFAKCLPARPVGTTPIVAWHEVPGTASLERAVP